MDTNVEKTSPKVSRPEGGDADTGQLQGELVPVSMGNSVGTEVSSPQRSFGPNDVIPAELLLNMYIENELNRITVGGGYCAHEKLIELAQWLQAVPLNLSDYLVLLSSVPKMDEASKWSPTSNPLTSVLAYRGNGDPPQMACPHCYWREDKIMVSKMKFQLTYTGFMAEWEETIGSGRHMNDAFVHTQDRYLLSNSGHTFILKCTQIQLRIRIVRSLQYLHQAILRQSDMTTVEIFPRPLKHTIAAIERMPALIRALCLGILAELASGCVFKAIKPWMYTKMREYIVMLLQSNMEPPVDEKYTEFQRVPRPLLLILKNVTARRVPANMQSNKLMVAETLLTKIPLKYDLDMYKLI
jgi:hypothetical protein